MLVELTTCPEGALPLDQFKEHLRLASGLAGEDLQENLLIGFLRAALAAIEGRTGKILIEREFRWQITRWRGTQAVILPVAPVSAIAEVALIDAEGEVTLWDEANWRLLPDAQAPSLVAKTRILPQIPEAGLARIDFLAGYGPDFADLPADLQQAVMLLAAHYHDYRHETALTSGCVPFGVTALTERYRTMRLTLGGAR